MNAIIIKQNEAGPIQWLLIQRTLYSEAKRVFVWRAGIALSLAIGGPLLTLVANDLGVYIGLIALGFLLVDNLFLEKAESDKKRNAAKVQELFDTYLFDLPWNKFVSGKKPDLEMIAEVSKRADQNTNGLRDWYSTAIAPVDLAFGRYCASALIVGGTRPCDINTVAFLWYRYVLLGASCRY